MIDMKLTNCLLQYKEKNPTQIAYRFLEKGMEKIFIDRIFYFIENDESYFNELKIYKKLEFVIPFMNIINIIFYILIKN